MPRIAIVTDSTAYIPPELITGFKCVVAPQVVIWGNEHFEDGVNITPTQFYSRLSKATVMPSTSQATIASFQKIYTDLLSQDYQILSILISEKLSGTLNSAIQAKAMLPASAPVEIVDSNSVAMALGFIVLTVGKAVQLGANMQECIALAERAREHTGVVFAVDTLEFLHRGGRIGGATRFLGTALNIKPILELRDGRVEPIERVRTRSKSLTRLVELIEAQIAGRTPVHLATLHANAAADAKALLAEASARLNAVESILSEVSPAVGTHAGPGTVGLAFMAGM